MNELIEFLQKIFEVTLNVVGGKILKSLHSFHRVFLYQNKLERFTIANIWKPYYEGPTSMEHLMTLNIVNNKIDNNSNFCQSQTP